MFSVKSLVELVKALAKFVVVLLVALLVLSRAQDGCSRWPTSHLNMPFLVPCRPSVGVPSGWLAR